MLGLYKKSKGVALWSTNITSGGVLFRCCVTEREKEMRELGVLVLGNRERENSGRVHFVWTNGFKLVVDFGQVITLVVTVLPL